MATRGKYKFQSCFWRKNEEKIVKIALLLVFEQLNAIFQRMFFFNFVDAENKKLEARQTAAAHEWTVGRASYSFNPESKK